MSEWIPVSEKLPPLGVAVIVAAKSYMGSFVTICSIDTGEHRFVNPQGFGGWDMESDFEYPDITHWMPAPEFPL